MYKELGFSKSNLPYKGHIPDLQLTRKDGTALYPTKDIAYSIMKFENHKADKVYNVISDEQSLPQFQMLLPLYQLGYKQIAKNLHHYAYGLVELQGRKMSGRKAIYITSDEYYDETKVRARMAKKASSKGKEESMDWEEEEEILTAVTLASTRFPLVETDPQKKIVLDLDRELDFRRNAGPFVLYAHARTCGIINRVKEEKNVEPSLDIDFSLLAEDQLSIEIAHHIDSFEEELKSAALEMNPSKIASWCNNLAQYFMKYYENNPILSADKPLMKARLLMVAIIQKGLKTGLSLLGIPPVDRI